MTVSELIAAYAEYTQLHRVLQSLLITVTSTYLIVTFVSSEKLGWGQLAFLSLLYAWIASDLIGGVYYHFTAAISIHEKLLELGQTEELMFLELAGAVANPAERQVLMWLIISCASVLFAVYNKYKAGS